MSNENGVCNKCQSIEECVCELLIDFGNCPVCLHWKNCVCLPEEIPEEIPELEWGFIDKEDKE